MTNPGMRNFILDNRLSSLNNSMISSLQLARSEAVKQKVDVVLCPSADSSNCSGDWTSAKRLVFIDDDADGVRDAGETIFRVDNAISSGESWSRVGGGATSITFDDAGVSDQQHTLKITDSRNKTRCVEVALSGRTGAVTCP